MREMCTLESAWVQALALFYVLRFYAHTDGRGAVPFRKRLLERNEVMSEAANSTVFSVVARHAGNNSSSIRGLMKKSYSKLLVQV